MAMWGGIPEPVEVTDIFIYAESKDRAYSLKRDLMRYLENCAVDLERVRIIPNVAEHSTQTVKHSYFWVTSPRESKLRVICTHIQEFCVKNSVQMSIKGVVPDFYISYDDIGRQIETEKGVGA